MEEIIQNLLKDSNSLLALCGSGCEEATEYQLFTRCLSDQTVVENGRRRLRTKEDGTMNSKALQNPSGPDATYRNKAGRQHRDIQQIRKKPSLKRVCGNGLSV